LAAAVFEIDSRIPPDQEVEADRNHMLCVMANLPRNAAEANLELGDFAIWSAAAVPDLIFSNTALQWVGGHAALFAWLMSLLAPGGVLAVQMPAMHDAPLRPHYPRRAYGTTLLAFRRLFLMAVV